MDSNLIWDTQKITCLNYEMELERRIADDELLWKMLINSNVKIQKRFSSLNFIRRNI